jgi:peroxiredoxin
MIILSLLVACSETDLGECPDFIECTAATGSPTATLETTYGEEGLCWDESTDEQALCRAACSDGLYALGLIYPDEPACQGSGSGSSAANQCDEITATGHEVGQIPEDLSLVNQAGDTVSLYDYCGQAVLILWSALWDGGFNATYGDASLYQDQYGADGLQVLGLVYENSSYEAPSSIELKSHHDDLGLSYPLLADPDQVGSRFEEDNNIPSLSLLGPGPVVLIRDGSVRSSDIEDALP